MYDLLNNPARPLGIRTAENIENIAASIEGRGASLGSTATLNTWVQATRDIANGMTAPEFIESYGQGDLEFLQQALGKNARTLVYAAEQNSPQLRSVA